MPRRREETRAAERSRSRDQGKQKVSAGADVDPPSERVRKHRRKAVDNGAEQSTDVKQKKRSSRLSQEVAEKDPYQGGDALDIELGSKEVVEKKAVRKHRKARDVSIDSEDLRGTDDPPSKKAAEKDSSTGVNFKDLYRKASKTLSKEQEGAEADPEDDVDFEELEARVKATERRPEPKAAPPQSSSASESEEPARPARRQSFFAATVDASLPDELRGKAAAAKQPQQTARAQAQSPSPVPQRAAPAQAQSPSPVPQRAARARPQSPSPSSSGSCSEPDVPKGLSNTGFSKEVEKAPPPKKGRFFGTSMNDSLPENLHGKYDPVQFGKDGRVAVGTSGLSQPELLAVADDGPPEAQELIPSVGASGIDFRQAREIRKQEEENAALSKALEARITTDTKEKTKGPMDLKSIKEKMAEDLEKARRARDQAQKEAEEKKQQEEEYYKASLGEPCGPDDRFVIIDELGKGEFASVFKCRDKEVRGSDGAFLEYAIKFTRNNENLKAAMEREIIMLGNICTQAVSLDAEGSRHILGLMFLNGFEHEEHLCCVYELMKCDMRMAMQRYTTGGGFPLYPTIRSLSRQLLLALRALAKCQILHCDVKPDNILLSLDRETIKLSDFGSAIEDSERKRTEYLQPRHYRCPEIILGQTYSTQVDVWSAGCTIYELATGKSLFVGEHNNAMIHEYLKLWGPFSKHFATVGHFAGKHFKEENCDFLNANGDFLVGTTNPAVLPMSHFEPPPRSLKVGIDAIAKPSGLEPKRFEALKGFLATLIRKCCMVDPAERATPEEALRNKLFEPGAGL